MNTKVFIAGIIGLAGGATILKGLAGRTSGASRYNTNRRGPMPELGNSPEKVFNEEVSKFRDNLAPLDREAFDLALSEFEEEMKEEKTVIVDQLAQALLLALLAKNSLEGHSSFVPKGIAFDTILRCELDSAALISEDSPNGKMLGKVATLYAQIKC